MPWREPHGVPANPDLVRGLGLFAIQYRKIRFDSKPGCGLDQEGPAGGFVKTRGTSVFPAPLRRNHDARRKRYLLGHGVSVLARGVGKPDPKRSTSEWSRTIENTCRAALEPAMKADGWWSFGEAAQFPGLMQNLPAFYLLLTGSVRTDPFPSAGFMQILHIRCLFWYSNGKEDRIGTGNRFAGCVWGAWRYGTECRGWIRQNQTA